MNVVMFAALSVVLTVDTPLMNAVSTFAPELVRVSVMDAGAVAIPPG